MILITAHIKQLLALLQSSKISIINATMVTDLFCHPVFFELRHLVLFLVNILVFNLFEST